MTPADPRKIVPWGRYGGLGGLLRTGPGAVVPTILLSLAIGLVSILAPPPGRAQDLGDRLCQEPVVPDDLAAGDLYACAVASEEGVAVIGSLLDDARGENSGSIYVFDFGGSGGVFEAVATTRKTQVKLVGATTRAGDQLGFSVATDGARVVAGAPFHDSTGDNDDNRGAAFVFSRVQGEWRQEARLTASWSAPRDQLGHAVAVAGPWVAVGAPGDDSQGSASGAVWIFELEQTAAGPAWAPTLRLRAADGRVGSGFGSALAMAGAEEGADTVLLAGAPFRDGGAGAVYVFEAGAVDPATGFTTWRQVARLAPAEAPASRLFGTSVALARDGDEWLAAVGARLDDGEGDNAGAVWIFRGRGEAWRQEARLVAPLPAAGDELGTAVALERDRLAVGARFGDAPGVADAGAVHLFERQQGEWRSVGTVSAPQPARGDELGFAVALDGGRLLTGAYRDDDFGPDAGTACAVQVADPVLQVTKTRDRTTVVPGEPVIYTITVENTGQADARQVQVTDRFPLPGAQACTWTCQASGRAACPAAAAAGPVAGDIAGTVSLPVGEAVVFTATCQVPAGATGALVNTATATTASSQPGEEVSARDTDRAVLAPRAGLRLRNILEGVEEGGNVASFRLEVTNDGPSVARDVVLDASFESDLALLGVSPNCGAGFPCALGDLAPGEVVEVGVGFQFQGDCTAPGSVAVALTATVTSNTTNPSTSNLRDMARPGSLTFCRSDLTLTAPPAAPTVVGGPLGYIVTVTNGGPQPVVGAQVTVPFPDGPDDTIPWTCVPTGNALCTASGVGDIVDRVTLGVGESVTYTAVQTAGVELCGRLPSQAAVQPPEGVVDPDETDNGGDITRVVLPAAGLCATKRLRAGAPVQSTGVAYQIQLVSNPQSYFDSQQASAGPKDPTTIAAPQFLSPSTPVFEDIMPEGLRIVGATADRGTVEFDPARLTWDDSLPPGEVVTLDLQVQLDADTAGQEICNQGTLRFGGLEVFTDDPTEPGAQDPTCFRVLGSVQQIPTLGEVALALLALALAGFGAFRLRTG